METFNPTSAFKPEKIESHSLEEYDGVSQEVFNFKSYRTDLAAKLKSIRGNSDEGREAAQQFLDQERFKVRYNVALELHQREEAITREQDREQRIPALVREYDSYIREDADSILGKTKYEGAETIPEPDYDLIDLSPVYPYEKDLDLSQEKKKEMMKNVVQYLRAKNIFVVFSKTIEDATANDTKEDYIELSESGERDLPIGELVGNKILINPWNVDFMSQFLTVGHLYGHMVQEMHMEEIKGIREFLAYPKPLDMDLVQKKYQEGYGNRDYKEDFKSFEEEAFAYAKFSFQEAGIDWTDKLEHATRVYIEADFDELWRWATESSEKEATSFNKLYNTYYEKYKGKFPNLQPKKVGVRVEPSEEESVRVVRDGEL